MGFENVYEDSDRADAYSRLEFPGTYYLAFRDIPKLISEHATGVSALDFGCGTGRSTRLLNKLGLNAIGIDISEQMLSKARSKDDDGEYFIINSGDLSQFKSNNYDVVLSAFTFDNIPTKKDKLDNLNEIQRILKPKGTFINLVSAPEIYLNEWASFSTKDFPENRDVKDGGIVRIIMKDVDDNRPVEDILCTHDAYLNLYEQAQFKVDKVHKPLAKYNEPFDWITETKTAPWVIYILVK